MVLILSSNEDCSTNDIINWLQTSWIRINKNYLINEINVNFDNSLSKAKIIFEDSTQLNLNDIKSYLYRRDDFSIKVNLNRNTKNHADISSILDKEWISLSFFIHNLLENVNSIGSFSNEKSHNKLLTLLLAQKIGLKIPNTSIVSSKNNLQSFFETHIKIITKAYGSIFQIQKQYFSQSIGTQEVEEFNIDKLGSVFFPTMIQLMIPKSYEVRIFYVKNEFYPMAIFSQNDEQTKLDYRNYNQEKSNRNIPYILPDDIKEKLQLLMDKLDLNTGSIDMIVTPEGEYVFLEVNPTGQFGWVSDNCNYYLEEKIANHLQGES